MSKTLTVEYVGPDDKPALLIFEKPGFLKREQVQAELKARVARYRCTEMHKSLKDSLKVLQQQWDQAQNGNCPPDLKEKWDGKTRPESVAEIKGDDYWDAVGHCSAEDFQKETDLNTYGVNDTIALLVSWEEKGSPVKKPIEEIREQWNTDGRASAKAIIIQARNKLFGLTQDEDSQ